MKEKCLNFNDDPRYFSNVVSGEFKNPSFIGNIKGKTLVRKWVKMLCRKSIIVSGDIWWKIGGKLYVTLNENLNTLKQRELS